MKIVDYFKCAENEYWLGKISQCDWRSGKYLCDLLKSGLLFEKTGENTKVLLLTDEDKLLAFCTLSEKKYDIKSSLTPWLGFVYVFPKYRGHRYSEELLKYAEKLVRAANAEGLYLSTKHIGLYEKFGYSFFGMMEDWRDEKQRVYFKPSAEMELTI